MKYMLRHNRQKKKKVFPQIVADNEARRRGHPGARDGQDRGRVPDRGVRFGRWRAAQ